MFMPFKADLIYSELITVYIILAVFGQNPRFAYSFNSLFHTLTFLISAILVLDRVLHY